MSGLCNKVPFFRLFADVQQSDTRIFDPIHMLRENRAEHPELVQYIRLAIRVGAYIEDKPDPAVLLRKHGSDARTDHAGNRFGAEHGADKHGAGITIAGKAVDLTFF